MTSFLGLPANLLQRYLESPGLRLRVWGGLRLVDPAVLRLCVFVVWLGGYLGLIWALSASGIA